MPEANPSMSHVEQGGRRRVMSGGLGNLGPYLARSAVVVVALFSLSLTLPSMPTWAVGLVLAMLSLVPATGSVYRSVVKRTFDYQKKFGEGSIHKGVFLLRIPLFIAFYTLSAASVASILVESPEWNVSMWATVVLAVPLYVAVSTKASWFVEKKEKAIPLVRDARAASFSVAATGLLLCAVFTVLSFHPTEAYVRAADAFLSAPKPFENSPSALMRETGDLAALVGGLRSYALARLSEASWHGYLIAQIILNAAAMFGVTGMLSVCLVEPRELKRVFLVLESDDERNASRPPIRPFCITFVILPLLLTAGIVCLDANVQDAARNDGYTFAKKIIRDQVNLVVYEMDGKYFDSEAVDKILEQAGNASQTLSREAEKDLVPLVNASFDERIANVDGYLDWYYGLFTDWEMLFNMVTGNAEDFAKEQLQARIERNVNDSELNSKLGQYLERAENLRSATLGKLSEYELANEYPDWLVKKAEPLDIVVNQTLEPSDGFLKANERLGVSLAVGAIAGVIAKKVVSKVAAKSAFKAITSRVAGLATASGAASAGGAAAFAAAVVASFGVDIAMVKADELMNRESYKQELASAIEEQRTETLAAMRARSLSTPPDDVGAENGHAPRFCPASLHIVSVITIIPPLRHCIAG